VLTLWVFFQLKPFNLSSPPLSTYNQQLWLTCVVELDQHDGEKLTYFSGNCYSNLYIISLISSVTYMILLLSGYGWWVFPLKQFIPLYPLPPVKAWTTLISRTGSKRYM